MKKKTFRLKTMWFHVTHMKPHGFSWKTMNFHDIPDFPAAAGSYHLSACHRTSSCIRDAARRHPPRGRPYNVAKMAHHSWVNPHIHLTLQSKSIMNQIGDPKKKSEKTTRDKRMARLGNFFPFFPSFVLPFLQRLRPTESMHCLELQGEPVVVAAPHRGVSLDNRADPANP